MPEMPELTWSQWFVPHAWAKHNWRLANETCNFAAAARDRGVLEVMEGETSKESEQTETVVAGLLFGAVRHYFILLASDDVGKNILFRQSDGRKQLLVRSKKLEGGAPMLR